MLMPLEVGFLQPYSSLGAAPEPYHIQETDDVIVFQMPVPGLNESGINVKVVNNRRLVIRSLKAQRFTPKFKYVFLMPDGVDKEEAIATIHNGILFVKLFKNKQ